MAQIGLKRLDECLLTVRVFKRDVQVKFSSVNYYDYLSEAEKQERFKKRSKIIKFSKRSAKAFETHNPEYGRHVEGFYNPNLSGKLSW